MRLFVHNDMMCCRVLSLFNMQAIAPVLPFKDCSHISIRPTMFVDVLTQKFGLELVGRRQVSTATGGFDRPLMILRKPVSG